MRVVPWLFPALLGAILAGCGGEEPDFGVQSAELAPRVVTDRQYLKDDLGRYVLFHGVNVSGSTKVPTSTDPLTYVGKPFPLDDADESFRRLAALGFNSIRLLLIWEAIEPHGRGEYDQEYLDYIEKIVRKAGEHGIYVLMDMHQDIFSRHLVARYNNGAPPEGLEAGSLEHQLWSLFPPYTDTVQGDGAPRWVIEACMPEKNLDSPHWGSFRSLGTVDLEDLANAMVLMNELLPDGSGGEIPPWLTDLFDNLPEERFEVTDTCDMLPWTMWGFNIALSLDVQRAYACLLAGDEAFPTQEVGGQNIKDYLQEAYAGAWAEVAKRVKGMPNVIGYDIMNEPGGFFLMLTAVATYFATGMDGAVEDLFVSLLGETAGLSLYQLATGLALLPQDTSIETQRAWGMDKADLFGILGLNYGFDANHLQPFYERSGKAILEEDPDAIIWIEDSAGLEMILGSLGQFEVLMTKPNGIEQVVFAPHWYPDIYPFIGFVQPPREFTDEQVKHRDYTDDLVKDMRMSTYSLGNIPVVYGEFGTYFNFNGINESIEEGYKISADILDNYYESFESLNQSRILWCYSPENTYERGDLWNKEDFSIVDPEGNTRGEMAFSRPYARAVSGKPRASHFYSDHHYYDPDKGTPDPIREYVLEFDSKETDAPTEIFVPEIQYPEGFYVWISDGYCVYNPDLHRLYYFPTVDEPGHVHNITLRPPQEGRPNLDYNYFFRGHQVLNGEAAGGLRGGL